MRAFDYAAGAVAGAAVAVLVQNAASAKARAAVPSSSSSSKNEKALHQLAAAMVRLEARLGTTCNALEAWLDDAVYDAESNQTFLDAPQTSAAVLATAYPDAAARSSTDRTQTDASMSKPPAEPVPPNQNPIKALCDAFDADIEGEDSDPLAAARILLDAGARAAALISADDERRCVINKP